MTAETITSNEDMAALSDRMLLERVCAQLDHLDTMIHQMMADNEQMLAAIRPLVPHIPRALALLDPGAAMRKTFRKGNRAIQERPPAPLHVRPAPEDRGPVGA